MLKSSPLNNVRQRNARNGWDLMQITFGIAAMVILAGIAVMGGLYLMNRANDSSAQSAARSAMPIVRAIADDNDGIYTNATSTNLAAEDKGLTWVAGTANSTDTKTVSVSPNASAVTLAVRGGGRCWYIYDNRDPAATGTSGPGAPGTWYGKSNTSSTCNAGTVNSGTTWSATKFPAR